MRIYFSRMKTKGQCPPRKPFKKIVWSWVGSFLGIFLIAYVGEVLHYDEKSLMMLIGSFGASAVLIYGAPLAEFSQPRNLIGGHVISAFVGVSVSLVFSENIMIASALAVSLAIMFMHLTRTLHPPGGASALIATIGGEQIYALGYWFIVTPVLLGSILLLVVALFVNNMSTNPNRHYPVYWI
ncbi:MULTISPECIES: HPP family protein [Thalassotalea]|uniref:HPP family protein n=1 Tax=Thalassotalea TaxID=1518149 RepID=UPI00094504D6|nr:MULTISPECIES: HPP family protein [Thalassotalea]OKY25850.1 hypothetical protein BI291_14690 [Thalassotalea sp. PP2-459]